jgi:hypothetical protein
MILVSCESDVVVGDDCGDLTVEIAFGFWIDRWIRWNHSFTDQRPNQGQIFPTPALFGTFALADCADCALATLSPLKSAKKEESCGGRAPCEL